MPILKGRRASGHPITLTPTSPPATATSYTVTISSASGVSGSSFSYTATPATGGWPVGEVVTPTVTGGTVSPTSATGSGTTPLVFAVTATGAGGTNCIVNSSALGMTNLTGAETYSITAVFASGNATRYDLTIDQSAGQAGTARTITASSNGNWKGDTIPITAHNGGSSVSVGTITTPSSGNTPQTISWTPTAVAAGEWIVKGASAGLYNPYGAPFNVFTPSSGTSRTISASLSLLPDVVHQRDCASGTPLGFTSLGGKGWGEVWINITALGGATDGIWVRLYDALNSDAALSGWVQVYGAVSATGEIRVLLPASAYVYHADVATNAAGANAVRLAQRFKVGHVAAVVQRSYECGLARSFGYTANQAALGTSYTKTATWVSYDSGSAYNDTNLANYAAGTTTVKWFVHDGSTVDPYNGHYGEGSSSATQEWGRLVESTYGVCGGFTGVTMSLRGLDSFVAHDGSIYDGFGGSINFATRGKCREVIITTADWDGVDSGYPSQVLGEVMTRYTNTVAWIATHFPSVAVISICGGASGWYGDNGSWDCGYARIQCAIADQLQATNPMVVSRTNLAWNDHSGASGHSSMAARVQFARTGFRLATAGETAAWGGLQTANRGPTLKGTGTVNSSGLIRLPGTYNGGTAISGVGIDFASPSWTVNTASSAELASPFSVYATGTNAGGGTAQAISSAVVNTTSLPAGADFTIDIQMVTPPSVDLFVNYSADQGVSNATIKPDWMGGPRRAVFFADNRIDTANGYQFGWELCPKVDIAVTRI